MVAEKTGVLIVMATSFHRKAWHPRQLTQRTQQQLEELLVADIVDGVGSLRNKAGFIEEIGISGAGPSINDIDPDEFEMLKPAAATLIICARPDAHNGEEDCCLAAQNLMLAAYAMGLGTHRIGFAKPWVNQARIKRGLSIPADYVPVFPVVVGYPSGDTPPVERRAPAILLWE
jgi:nitroreductase